jgi:hypothetical protein
MLDNDMNLIKMRIFRGHRKMAINKFETWIVEAVDSNLHGAKMIQGNWAISMECIYDY